MTNNERRRCKSKVRRDRTYRCMLDEGHEQMHASLTGAPGEWFRWSNRLRGVSTGTEEQDA